MLPIKHLTLIPGRYPPGVYLDRQICGLLQEAWALSTGFYCAYALILWSEMIVEMRHQLFHQYHQAIRCQHLELVKG